MEDVSVIEYLRLIKLNLIGDKHKKEEFTASLKDNLSNYLAEHPQVTLDELFTEFGTPEEVSEEFAAAFPSSSLADARTKSWAIKVCRHFRGGSDCFLYDLQSLPARKFSEWVLYGDRQRG